MRCGNLQYCILSIRKAPPGEWCTNVRDPQIIGESKDYKFQSVGHESSSRDIFLKLMDTAKQGN